MSDEAMKIIQGKNRSRSAIWCAILLAVGCLLTATVYLDDVLTKYYNVSLYCILELVLVVLLTALAWGWWYLATSPGEHVVGARHWISTHGGTSVLFSWLTAWIITVIIHVVCTALCVKGSSGVRIYSIFIQPLAFTALSYLLPPIEICEVVLPGGGIGQKVARGLIVLVSAAFAAWLFRYDFI